MGTQEDPAEMQGRNSLSSLERTQFPPSECQHQTAPRGLQEPNTKPEESSRALRGRGVAVFRKLRLLVVLSPHTCALQTRPPLETGVTASAVLWRAPGLWSLKGTDAEVPQERSLRSEGDSTEQKRRSQPGRSGTCRMWAPLGGNPRGLAVATPPSVVAFVSCFSFKKPLWKPRVFSLVRRAGRADCV